MSQLPKLKFNIIHVRHYHIAIRYSKKYIHINFVFNSIFFINQAHLLLKTIIYKHTL